MSKTCKSCEWFVADRSKPYFGQCYALPPVIFGGIRIAARPIVGEDDHYCREWELAEAYDSKKPVTPAIPSPPKKRGK